MKKYHDDMEEDVKIAYMNANYSENFLSLVIQAQITSQKHVYYATSNSSLICICMFYIRISFAMSHKNIFIFCFRSFL